MTDGGFVVSASDDTWCFLPFTICNALSWWQNDLDYMDDNAEKLGRQKMRSDAMKRQFAIQGTSNIRRHLRVGTQSI